MQFFSYRKDIEFLVRQWDEPDRIVSMPWSGGIPFLPTETISEMSLYYIRVNALIGRYPFSTMNATSVQEINNVCQCPNRAVSLFYEDIEMLPGERLVCVNALIGRYPFSTNNITKQERHENGSVNALIGRYPFSTSIQMNSS